jgi:four helix bundle protein
MGNPPGSGRADGNSTSQTAYWLELLVDAKIVPPRKLEPLRRECDELTAIFVTIIKRAKE